MSQIISANRKAMRANDEAGNSDLPCIIAGTNAGRVESNHLGIYHHGKRIGRFVYSREPRRLEGRGFQRVVALISDECELREEEPLEESGK